LIHPAGNGRGIKTISFAVKENISCYYRFDQPNTGQTFSANRVTSGTEAVFFPRLGDWAVLTTGGEVKTAGFFDETWKLKN
jgi:hypothetical protein